jgi:hypothetical protein
MLRVSDAKGNFKPRYFQMFQNTKHGKIYLNAHSSKPNTPGTLNSFFFGVHLSDNPSRFVDTYPHDSGLASFLSRPTVGDVQLYSYSPEPDNSEAIFPKDAEIFFFETENQFWSKLKSTVAPSFFFFVDNDYHGTIGDYSSSAFGEGVADKHFLVRLPGVIELAKESGVTKLLIFSDHGFHSTSDFANSLKPLGKHRSGVLWYETDFVSSLESDNTTVPVGHLARAFFSKVTTRAPIEPRQQIAEANTDLIVEDSWLPPFLHVVLGRHAGARLRFDLGATTGKTELLIGGPSSAHSIKPSEDKEPSKPWRGSFLSEARVSIERPQAPVRLLFNLLSKVLFASQVAWVWLRVVFRKPSIDVLIDGVDELRIPRTVRWCLRLIERSGS